MVREISYKSKEGAPSSCRSVHPAVSSDIVRYLQDQGMTLRKIGGILRLSESFISRVRNGQRSFTLEHLTRLERAIKKPLPIILMEATQLNSVPKEVRHVYAAFRDFVAGLGRLRMID